MTEAAVLGLADDRRADRRELIAKPDIVQEAGDLAVGLAALRAADDQVRQGRQLGEIESPTEFQPLSLAFSAFARSRVITWIGFSSLL